VKRSESDWRLSVWTCILYTGHLISATFIVRHHIGRKVHCRRRGKTDVIADVLLISANVKSASYHGRTDAGARRRRQWKHTTPPIVHSCIINGTRWNRTWLYLYVSVGIAK